MVICDEMSAHYGVFAYASDMECFQPLMGAINDTEYIPSILLPTQGMDV